MLDGNSGAFSSPARPRHGHAHRLYPSGIGQVPEGAESSGWPPGTGASPVCDCTTTPPCICPPGTHLIASNRWQDYTDFHVPTTLGYLKSPFYKKKWRLPDHYVNSPITAIDAENVAVIGEPGSWIDGSDCLDPQGEEGFRGPMGMVFCRCRGVTLRGYTYRNAANWCHQLDSCIQVRMDHVTVLGGHDGVNLHHCTQVWIDSCDFRTGDDCIAGYDAENVVVRNCSLNTSCNSFRFGAGTSWWNTAASGGRGISPPLLRAAQHPLRLRLLRLPLRPVPVGQ